MATPDKPTLADIRAWPATIGVPDAAKALGVSKSHMHALIKRGESPVRTLSFGARHRVVTADLIRLLEAA
ncbi:helix-turn-helix domain-containing protein [Streptomyces microflavus]|uniref:Helix-turn-helix domain-containing protein n=1 Tax=Streptomyces microflavus TaxID=1919 RepID=A0A7H8MHU2_STRMI|nr:helix-turn-helix domain-containing protein [Streptomyces microflavus]QKW41713.1 helix-turn-helix domain-containing protein [Streptomyces microflavus]